MVTLHELVLLNVDDEEKRLALDQMRGDKYFLKEYKEIFLPYINLNNIASQGIIECYEQSKKIIQYAYPEYYHVTYYKKIVATEIFNKQPIKIAYDTYKLDVRITETNKLIIGILIYAEKNEKFPLEDKIKERYVTTELILTPDKDKLNMISDVNLFNFLISEKIKDKLWKNIKFNEGIKVFNEVKIKFDNLVQTIMSYLIPRELQSIIYREKIIIEEPLQNDMKNWFHEFCYTLRNVLFHRIINLFDSNWAGIVKTASIPLKEIIIWNVQELNKQSSK